MTTNLPTQTQDLQLNWKITGLAGEGVMLSTKLVGKSFIRHGWHSFTYFEYPSLIKGGHQTGQVLARPTQATSQKLMLDVLIVLNNGGWKEHLDEIDQNTKIIFNINAGLITPQEKATLPTQITELEILKLATSSTQNPQNSNIVSVGISAKLLGLDSEITKQVIKDEFVGKKQEVIDSLLKAFDAGYQAIDTQVPKILTFENKNIMATGSEAIGLGALASGIQFYSAYPMTPSTALMQFLAEQQENFPLVVKHSEDEIGAINHAIGASYAGLRSMTGSSGGGIALMGEAVSFVSIAELPLVILTASRVGPATGLPTWTAQADLQFLLGLGHGEVQKVILTPGTIEEHFKLTKTAFYLAEKYQLPVFILSDKHALESHFTFAFNELETKVERQSLNLTPSQDDSYLRYQVSDTGISPRTYPGIEHGLHLANSYEHDQWGFATEKAQETTAQVDKRAKKFVQLEGEIPQPVLLGPAQASLTVVCWGSTIGVMSEVLYQLKLQGKENQLNVIHVPCVWPFPAKTFTDLAKQSTKLLIIEGNQSGQLEKLIKQETGLKIDHHYRKYDGRPFYSEDILKVITSL